MRSNPFPLLIALAMLAGVVARLHHRAPRAAEGESDQRTMSPTAPKSSPADASAGGDASLDAEPLDDEEDSLPAGGVGRTLASGRSVWEPAELPPPLDPAAALAGKR